MSSEAGRETVVRAQFANRQGFTCRGRPFAAC